MQTLRASQIQEAAAPYAPMTEICTYKFDRNSNIDDIIKIRQSIKIDKEDFYDLGKCFSRDVAKTIKRKISTDGIEDLSYLNDGYDNLEYYGTYNTYFISNECIDYIKAYAPDYVLMNLYNIKNSSLPSFLQKYVKEEPNEVPKFKYEQYFPDEIKYTRFTEKKYKIVEVDGRTVSCLYVNLPYEYYKNIETIDLVASYDINKEDFIFSGTSSKEQIELMQDIAENGLYTPLALQIKYGTIISTRECHSRFAAARMLRLPEIPVCLYFVPEQMELLENKIKLDDDLTFINNLCDPYMYFRKKDE